MALGVPKGEGAAVLGVPTLISNLLDGQVLQFSAALNAFINATVSGGGAVSSVSNVDGTLTISPTTGAVVASLALGHANTWTATQTFPAASLTNAELAGPVVTGLTTETAAGITLTASGSGVGTFAYTPSVALGGDLSGSSLGATTVVGLQGSAVTLTSLAAGAILYYSGIAWVNLPIGTSGQVLEVVSGLPSWQAGGGGAVSSVSNADGTLTISPTTGAVVASLALGNANTWTALQTFGNDISFGGATVDVTGLTAGLTLGTPDGTTWQALAPVYAFGHNSHAFASTSALMLGLVTSMTPTLTGRILVFVSGYVNFAAVSGETVTLQINYGTSGQPSAGAAATGTGMNPSAAQPVILKTGTGSTAESLGFGFSLVGALNFGSVGTNIWVDVQVTCSSATSTTVAAGILVCELR